jgi:hypothetical protein
MLLDCVLIEGIDLRCLGGASRGADLLSQCPNPRDRTPRKKDVRSLAGNAPATAPPIAPPAP